MSKQPNALFLEEDADIIGESFEPEFVYELTKLIAEIKPKLDRIAELIGPGAEELELAWFLNTEDTRQHEFSRIEQQHIRSLQEAARGALANLTTEETNS